MKFHKDGTRPTGGEIFVFGSNLGGIHGAGAALAAHQLFGAKMFIGVGPTGRAYAIPTKNETIRHSLPIAVIEAYVDQFVAYAMNAKDRNEHFFVTAIGCGLAGFHPIDIAPLFQNVPDNVSLPDSWKPYL